MRISKIIAGIVASVLALAACVIISGKTQFSDQVKARDTSQLTKGMSRPLQKLLKCFNGTTVSRFALIFVLFCSAFSTFGVSLK